MRPNYRVKEQIVLKTTEAFFLKCQVYIKLRNSLEFIITKKKFWRNTAYCIFFSTFSDPIQRQDAVSSVIVVKYSSYLQLGKWAKIGGLEK